MSTFDIYRYQILPASQQQQSLFNELVSADELRLRKNHYFSEILNGEMNFEHKGLIIKCIRENIGSNLYLFKIGVYKNVDRDNEDFQREKIPSWPNVTVIINNLDDRQTILISRNVKAFSTTKVVSNILEKTFDQALNYMGLTIQIRETFNPNHFWGLMRENEGRVDRVRFEMVAPNMASITKALKIDLRQLNRESNCQKVSLQLESLPKTALEIDPEDELIKGCVEYASLGGGDIVVKLKGVRKEIRTSEKIQIVEIDEMTLSGLNQDTLLLLNENL
ncbi:hypothetical protein [Comamonas sp. AG1104]|uniref:hypothetical protein n=1 Tax=Comamonas sp. AG1104 TaxID=2183900 RepID=UPI000E2AAB61|nr:hypothetical protein [Comamonas sp. AG1104]RDI11731.1 hypothetical protein DFO48_104425 [Comamonas sp. AG1104]